MAMALPEYVPPVGIRPDCSLRASTPRAAGWSSLPTSRISTSRPFTTAFHVGQMLEGFDRLFTLAPSRAHIVPGHDPEVMRRYPAPRPELEGIVVRLDVAPHQGSQP
jgi:hypothetical protein